MNTDLKIVAVAIRDSTGQMWSLPPPNRHHHVLHLMHEVGVESTLDDQGFLLNDGRWVSRKAAASLALNNGQAKQLIAPPDLYSEDLW